MQMQSWNRCVPLSRALTFPRWLSVRHSCTQLFVGGLCYDTNEAILKDAFGRHGEIVEVKVICDHVSGKSKGFGFVKFTTESAACKALKDMDGQVLEGRNIRVHCAHKG
ncbi:glycine-rich RNA-binding protein 2, mitochondrial-like [Tripterygium wilfordii]|uniref:glycine-rich RNA-binding protein 2, mitochondrial-like n=1 Tax=Tripterygium wilfordii TaxID=458696 RepID=UPI0018F7F14D|nr:glycine-rich RNA-binding protein 2, mitochondrial-like [Tripterygium wilfordii]